MKRAALALAFALAGCGHIETHDVLLRADSAPTARDPELYMEDRAPQRAFYDVAIVQVIGFGSDANTDDVIAGIVARGRGLGCDAVVRVRVDIGLSRANGFGVCVRWSPGRAPSAPPPPPSAPTSAPPASSSDATSL
jgi:hypothetical protein